jgi:hypothetical protein
MSSFEMLKSGFVQELLAFAADEKRYSECTCVLGSSCAKYSSAVPLKVRQCLIFEALTFWSSFGSVPQPSNPPFAIVVKRLQESLTWMSTVKDAPCNKPLRATAVDSSGEAKQTAAEPSAFESDQGPRRSSCLTAKSRARSTPSLPQHSVPEAKTPSTSSSQAQAKVETIEPMDGRLVHGR